MNDLLKKEALVDQYVQAGDTDAAVKCLYELIVAYAKKKDFARAETLRDRLFEVDAMALTEIVRSGEIIEEEKSEHRDDDHQAVWSDLYEFLTTEEANEMYYAMKEGTYETSEDVFKQGETDSNLYLINEGEIKITYHTEVRENLLKTLGPGHLFGEETFFSNTAFCTTTATALSPVRLNYLEKGVLKSWNEKAPMLEQNLHDFCLRKRKLHEALKEQDLDRRTQKRIRLTGRLVVQLIDANGKPVGKPFKGSFSDISQGGLAFLIRISKKETAHLLLGRDLILKFVLPFEDTKKEVKKISKVIGIQSQAFGDYAVHVKFRDLLSRTYMKALEGLKEVGSLEEPEIELSGSDL